MSSDVYAIIDLVASMLTHEHLSYYSEHPSAIKGMFQQSIYRSLGLSAHLAWARLLIDRTNEQVKYPDARSNNRKPRDSGDDEAIAHENYWETTPNATHANCDGRKTEVEVKKGNATVRKSRVF